MEKEIVQENPMLPKVRYNNITRCESHIFGPKWKYSRQQVSEDTQYTKASQTGGNSSFFALSEEKVGLSRYTVFNGYELQSYKFNIPKNKIPSPSVLLWPKHYICMLHSSK